MRRAWTATVVVALSATLAGCAGAPAASAPSTAAAATASAASTASSSAPSASAAPAAAPATGATIRGTGYRYVVPKGWKVPEGTAAQSTPDSLAVDLTDTDGFADNVNVIVLKTGAFTAADVETQGTAGLKRVGATKIAVRDRVTVAGSETAHVTALTSGSGAEYRVDQYYLGHGGKAYVVTFSFSPKVSQSDRNEVSDSVLATWSWT